MKKIISVLMALLIAFSAASFSVSASNGISFTITPNNIDSSLNVSGTVDSARDNIRMTLRIMQNGTVIAAEETIAIGKTADGVPFSFNPIVLSATVISGTLDVEVTASKINLKETQTYEYVGVDNQYTAIDRVSDALLGGNTSFLMDEIKETAADLGVVYSDYENLSADSQLVVKDIIKDLRLDLPGGFDTIALCVKIREEIEEYKDKYREAIAVAQFFDLESVDALKTWYDTYKTAYKFEDDNTDTPVNETAMISYFNEAITSSGYLNRIDNVKSARTIKDLNLAMKHQALLQQVQDSNQNVVSRILADFPLLLTGVNYASYNSFTTTQRSMVTNAVAGKFYSSLTDFTNEVNAQIIVASQSSYVPGGTSSSSSSGKKGGSSGNYVAAAESLTVDVKTVEFTDIENVSWANEAINYLYKEGIVSGKSEKTFAPNDNVTRAELIKMLVLGLNLKAGDKTISFGDVSNNAWYADYVKIAASNGLITGDENGNFNPNKPITRQDAATMMYRAISSEDKATAAPFEDYNEIADYSKAAVDYMYKQGIINGIGDGKFAPKNNVTRAQIAKMLYLLLV